MLRPAGPVAARITGWWWLMFGIAAVVLFLVVALLLVGLLRRRQEYGEPHDRPWLTFVVLAGAVTPAVVLSSMMGLNLYSEHLVARGVEASDLTIEVIGHRWWWEFRYPEAGVVTANELHIPAGRPVRLELTSVDVIHSFWVPTLSGKLDLIPGQTNVLELAASQVGTQRGQCAEFCGLQHANMAFLVFSEPESTFQAWLERQAQPAPIPATQRQLEGQQAFEGSACVYCHTVRGTNASGTVGPDLTHIASRATLGAATLTNTPGHLAGWIVNSQAIKPGNMMPPMILEPDALQALMAYLATLE